MRKFFGILLLLGLIVAGINAIPKTSEPATAPGESPKPAPPPKLSQVKIEKWNWNKSGFGSVMIATFVLKNLNEVAVKDIEITCEHSGNSGTVIDSNKRTIYETIKAKSSKTIPNFSMGFIHSQASQSSCSITDYVYLNNFSDAFGKVQR